ncbi:MAG TPA: arginase family protein [Gaiellales bacterium]|nr:arginase family protein [Gaiellales bacterium]
MPRRDIAVVGAPSSAGAYAVGQEDAPRVLRELGLVERLAAAGCRVRDVGDIPLARWRPDREHPRAQNVAAVVSAAGAVRDAVAGAIGRGELALVLGGDCTVGVGTVAGAVVAGAGPGLVYVDMHADLNTPASVTDGALDWMGVAHMLALDGCTPELRDLGPATPLLRPSQVVVVGHEASQATEWEREAIARLGVRTVAAADVREDAPAAAAAARAMLAGSDLVLLHLDIDVVDFVDAPLSENTGRNVGVPLAAALDLAAAVLADDRTSAVTLTELNPAHAAADPGVLDRLLDGLVAAIAA